MVCKYFIYFLNWIANSFKVLILKIWSTWIIAGIALIDQFTSKQIQKQKWAAGMHSKKSNFTEVQMKLYTWIINVAEKQKCQISYFA